MVAHDVPARRPWVKGLSDVHLAPGIALGLSIAMVLAISVGDLLTGPYLVFATFYLVPVLVSGWFTGRTQSLFVGVLAALTGAVSTALDPGEVTKGVVLWNALFRFTTYALITVLVDAERKAMATIQVLSARDALTGLTNRGRFYEMAESELRRASRSGQPIAIVYIDVDDLKFRNDTYGHQSGDELLLEFADIARRTFRSTDLLARLGGDEFCFLLPNADLETAEQVLDRLEAALEVAHPLPIRVSSGVVSDTVDSNFDVETIIHAADALMYEAKASGKGQRRSRRSFEDLSP